ncbi:MAG: YidC/Oxa1 family membrane protein insertase [Thermaerobacter sp.]|nr:YidC/Oxa1 family membrane protein insertase [Thermaerobacter sp.]
MAIFYALVSGMEWVLQQFYLFTHSYGLAIILLTIVVRIVIMPLYHGQLRYMRKMQEVQPEMKRIQQKFKGDPQRINQETMELYKRAGTNPLSGCIPMIVQLPLLYALFEALQKFHYVGVPTFLWLPTLSKPDPYFILPALVAVSTFWQTWVTMPRGTVDRSQQMITYILMPAFLFYISMRYPSGLSLYWLFATLFTVAQSYVMGVGRPRTPVVKANK